MARQPIHIWTADDWSDACACDAVSSDVSAHTLADYVDAAPSADMLSPAEKAAAKAERAATKTAKAEAKAAKAAAAAEQKARELRASEYARKRVLVHLRRVERARLARNT